MRGECEIVQATHFLRTLPRRLSRCVRAMNSRPNFIAGFYSHSNRKRWQSTPQSRVQRVGGNETQHSQHMNDGVISHARENLRLEGRAAHGVCSARGAQQLSRSKQWICQVNRFVVKAPAELEPLSAVTQRSWSGPAAQQFLVVSCNHPLRQFCALC